MTVLIDIAMTFVVIQAIARSKKSPKLWFQEKNYNYFFWYNFSSFSPLISKLLHVILGGIPCAGPLPVYELWGMPATKKSPFFVLIMPFFRSFPPLLKILQPKITSEFPSATPPNFQLIPFQPMKRRRIALMARCHFGPYPSLISLILS